MDGEAWEIKGWLGLQADWFERWESLSRCERKRASIAEALRHEPLVVALDEPMNHLDLTSGECLDEALDACPCGLLLVSHDERILSRLTAKRRRVNALAGGDAELKIVGE